MTKKYYFIIFLILIFLYKNVFSAFYLTEILPYTEDDVNNEYVEITYDGFGVNSLSGYILSDKSGKEYLFGDDTYIKNENKKYYRPQTKILLNNSDEEIYLKNISGELEDSFSYSTTELGKIYKKEILENELVIENNNEINLEENTSSGNYIETETSTGTIDEEEALNYIETETSTGTIDETIETNSGNTQETGIGVITNDTETSTGETIEKINIYIKNTFQSPTYLLEKDTSLSDGFTYNCDRTKDDCRVNFDFRTTFSSLKESDFNCLSDFGLGGITGEENKCNPNTIIFPIGITTLNIKIIHKTNLNHFGEISFKIKNDGKKIETNNTSSTIIYTNLDTTSSSKPKFEIIPPIVKIQSGLEKDNTCNKKECKINFLYEKTHNDLVCSWDFGENIDGDGNENKCNPNYVYFPSGKHNIFLEICDKNNLDNCKKSEFVFENKYEYIEPKSIITIQGKLSKNKLLIDNKITCIESDNCSINFDGSESLGENLTYFWDFGNGEYFEGKNPKSIVFEIGNYQVIFEISDEFGNYSQDFFEIEVTGKEIEILDLKESENKNEDQTLSGIQEKQLHSLKIDLQGKLGINKILSGNKITCIKTCSVNFDGSNSIGDFASYFWDFGNGETYDGKNPPYISYKDFGIYNVIFSGEIKSGELIEKEFIVEYYKDIQKDENNLIIIDKQKDSDFISNENYYDDDISLEIEDIGNKKYNKDLIISIFIFIFLGFILGLFILKKYKII